jgi:hypothetical protein
MKARHPRRAPPWWPTGEPWPPSGPGAWHGPPAFRGRFLQRIGCLLALFATVVFSIFALLFWLVASWIGLVELPRSALLLAGGFGVAGVGVGLFSLILLGRSLRRMAAPVDELLSAAEQISRGD